MVGSDIEIARGASVAPIGEIAGKLGIPSEAISPYGQSKAKVSLDFVESLKDRADGKLILVTAITPTPAGEGKTTTSVGLTDGLNRIGKQAVVCLREPSDDAEVVGHGTTQPDPYDAHPALAATAAKRAPPLFGLELGDHNAKRARRDEAGGAAPWKITAASPFALP